MWFYFGMVGSFVFIIIQLILLIDFAHSWNQAWLEKAENGNSKCWFAGIKREERQVAVSGSVSQFDFPTQKCATL